MNKRLLSKTVFTTAAALISGDVHAQTAPALTPEPTPEPTPEHTLDTKVSFYNEYENRGITQTSEMPALQLNLGYWHYSHSSHSSRVDLSAFPTNIKRRMDTGKAGGFKGEGALELDWFGGYKFEIVKDVTIDIGYLRYEYPSNSGANPKPNTDKFYIGLAGGPFFTKYSHATSTLFGVPNSQGSTFVERSWAQEVMPTLTLNTNRTSDI